MEKIGKKCDDFNSRYGLDLAPTVSNGTVKAGEGIQQLLTLDDEMLVTLASRLEKKMETDDKVKIKKEK
ncbi:MAG: hypothetical protein HETSPECPRED_007542 [Heterodermia speciosa]|uniref:Uncharacterized protein n=1 Tax=Heterodermia speciosa TaxID=116794 RepID=A0A8H3FW03_9LECA|nr:MAG: hypothetical protein HETSPECPRED_007542 [Heterodermia speciosa]